jgi:hypothetical protein
MEHTLMQMEQNMKVLGKEIYKMVKELKHGKMAANMKDNIRME